MLCIRATLHALEEVLPKNNSTTDRPIVAIGITNQRETTIAWNSKTGVPYYNAIVWDDTRTTHIAHELAAGNTDRLRNKTGLPLASYFAGTKVKWLLDNVPRLANDISDESTKEFVKFGTIDSWLMYQLTGQPNIDDSSSSETAANVGGLHITDATNASRWLFCDISKVEWDQSLVDRVCAPHKVPLSALPAIRSSSEVYAQCTLPFLKGVPIASILGDQHAALFGQCAFEAGEAKNTYGTGLFLMMNTGKKRVPSKHGLLTTIAYHIGDEVVYALEGSVSHSGSTIQWLRDQLCIIKDAAESETLARTTEHNDGLYFVPAFAGLFAPYWRSDARACIVGMTATHRKGHICRAALEATAYQTREVFDAMYSDSKVVLKQLKVDGGGTHNKLLMQFQSDIIDVPVVQPKVMETTAMGAAFAAGLAVGVWKDMSEIKAYWSVAKSYTPQMKAAERAKNWAGWKKAITKSLNWVEEEEESPIMKLLGSVRPLVVPSLTVGCGIAAGYFLGRRK